jgi:DNA repair exonuclease SbcCD ATPase subunit
MESIKWHELITGEEWANVLGEILDVAKAVLLENDSDKLGDIQDTLDKFVKESPSYCRVLDDIAAKASLNIFVTETNEALKRITERNAELKKALELIKGTTARMKKSRKAIQFEGVIEILNKAKTAIDELKNIGETFDEKEKSILEKIVDIGKAIEKVREEISAVDKKKKKKKKK